MRFLLVFVIVLVLAFPGFLEAVTEDSAAYSQDPPEDLVDTVFVETYKKVSLSHLVVTQTTKSSYENVVIYTFTSSPVKVFVNGELISEFTPSGEGTKLLLKFSEGDSVDLRVAVGSAYYDYSFNVRKTISIKELDPDEKILDLPTFEAAEVVVFCCISFLAAAVGIYGMYRFFKNKALMEVRPLGKD